MLTQEADVEIHALPRRGWSIVCYELGGDTETVILDATAEAVIAATSTLEETARCAAEGPTRPAPATKADRRADRRR
jgi:hypothetical protein